MASDKPTADSSDVRIISKEELAKHKTREDLWVTIHGRVFNVTNFAEEHPGGDEVLLEWAGDASDEPSKAFDDIMHSQQAIDLMKQYYVGNLEGAKVTIPEASGATKKVASKTPVAAGTLQTSPQAYKRVIIPILFIAVAYLINWLVTKP
eukprot:TRINITY_DN21657_c0_g1_i1.p1 TRINITY_DN21657_c0_g1~~TRINITY_DN21657_c0_g1_i1.p1  ORF type:complete len:150 (+),score=11.55 TRINITY_DN21657_c0_g1_i1:32-481(+)